MDARDAVTAELGTTWFGGGLSPHARSGLAAAATPREVPPDTVLLREGEETAIFAIITRGRVALRMRVPERGPVTILTVEPGDVVGWSSIVRPHRATSTAVTVEASRLLVFDARQLRALLESDIALAATLYPRIAEAVGRRLSATRQQLLDLYAQQAEQVPW